MSIVKKLLLSKTIDANAGYALIMAILAANGVAVPPELAAYGLAGLNILLRFITKEPLMEKTSFL
jgi:hypothetical protein